MTDDTILFSQLPRATRVILKLFSKNNHPIGWVGCHLFTFDHQLRTGGVKLQLWPGECPTENATSLENKGDGADQQWMSLEFLAAAGVPIYHEQLEVVKETKGPVRGDGLKARPSETRTGKDKDKDFKFILEQLDKSQKKQLMRILQDPIADLEKKDHDLLWGMRGDFRNLAPVPPLAPNDVHHPPPTPPNRLAFDTCILRQTAPTVHACPHLHQINRKSQVISSGVGASPTCS